MNDKRFNLSTLAKKCFIAITVTVYVSYVLQTFAMVYAFSRFAPEYPIYPSILAVCAPLIYFATAYVVNRKQQLLDRFYNTSLQSLVGFGIAAIIIFLISTLAIVSLDIYMSYIVGYQYFTGWILATMIYALTYSRHKNPNEHYYKLFRIGSLILIGASILSITALVVSSAVNARSIVGFLGPFTSPEFGLGVLVVIIFFATHLVVRKTLFEAILWTATGALTVLSLQLVISAISKL